LLNKIQKSSERRWVGGKDEKEAGPDLSASQKAAQPTVIEL
jgi:hypothetical protein